jgi:hypothetical protein
MVVNRGFVDFGPLSPGESIYSDVLDNSFGQEVPITLAVQKVEPEVTPSDPPPLTRTDRNLCVTAYHLTTLGLFRIAVTNIGQAPVETIQVTWWALGP